MVGRNHQLPMQKTLKEHALGPAVMGRDRIPSADVPSTGSSVSLLGSSLLTRAAFPSASPSLETGKVGQRNGVSIRSKVFSFVRFVHDTWVRASNEAAFPRCTTAADARFELLTPFAAKSRRQAVSCALTLVQVMSLRRHAVRGMSGVCVDRETSVTPFCLLSWRLRIDVCTYVCANPFVDFVMFAFQKNP